MNKLTNLFAALEVSATGLMAQRRRMNAIAENLANVHTTRTEEGGPYRRKVARFAEARRRPSLRQAPQARIEFLELLRTRSGHIVAGEAEKAPRTLSGVRADITRDTRPPTMVYDPGHPDADENGYVQMPNINVVTEMVDMISASRAYEANVTAVKTTKEMANKALEI